VKVGKRKLTGIERENQQHHQTCLSLEERTSLGRKKEHLGFSGLMFKVSHGRGIGGERIETLWWSDSLVKKLRFAGIGGFWRV